MKISNFKKLWISVAVLLFFSACSKKNYSIEIVNNVEMYINKNIPNDNDLKIKMNEVVKIKSNINDSLSNFTKPIAFNVDKLGNIYIIDQFSSSIKTFNSQGKFIKSIGQKGKGPGEFMFPAAVLPVSGKLFILDTQQKNISIFDHNMNFIESINKQNEMPFFLNNNNNDVITGFSANFKVNGKVLDLSLNFDIFDNNFTSIQTITKSTHSINLQKPFNVFDIINLTAISDSLIFFSSNSEDKYLINVYNLSGKLKYSISKNYLKNVYSRDDFESDAKILKNMSDFKVDLKTIKFKKAINAIFCDDQERIWVATSKTTNEKNKKGLKFDIFKEGVYLNSIYLNIPKISDYLVFSSIKIIKNKIYYLDQINSTLTIFDYVL